MGNLEEARLLSTSRFQGEEENVLEAIYHVVEHFSLHTGQIIYQTKILTAQDLSLYCDIQRGGWLVSQEKVWVTR